MPRTYKSYTKNKNKVPSPQSKPDIPSNTNTNTNTFLGNMMSGFSLGTGMEMARGLFSGISPTNHSDNTNANANSNSNTNANSNSNTNCDYLKSNLDQCKNEAMFDCQYLIELYQRNCSHNHKNGDDLFSMNSK